MGTRPSHLCRAFWENLPVSTITGAPKTGPTLQPAPPSGAPLSTDPSAYYAKQAGCPWPGSKGRRLSPSPLLPGFLRWYKAHSPLEPGTGRPFCPNHATIFLVSVLSTSPGEEKPSALGLGGGSHRQIRQTPSSSRLGHGDREDRVHFKSSGTVKSTSEISGNAPFLEPTHDPAGSLLVTLALASDVPARKWARRPQGGSRR